MTTDEAIKADEAIAPFVAKLPAHARGEFEAGREAAVARKALDDDAREALLCAERDRLAEEARAELIAQRTAQRWAMWCNSVPELYRDDRADAGSYTRQPFAWWLARPDVDPAIAGKVAAWLADAEGKTIVLFGETGTGKTTTAIAAGYAAAGRGVHARFVSQLDYLRLLRPGGADDPALVRFQAESTSLLVLDDLGAEMENTGASDFTRQEVISLLDARLRENRRQIITTNLMPEELVETFGHRIVSRLRDRAVVCPLPQGDHRQTAAEPW
jgi:hypothetical protein